MKKIIKIISVVMSVVLISGLFGGCGSKEEKTGKVKIIAPDRVLNEVGINAFVKQKQEEFDELYGDEIEVEHILPVSSSDVNDVQNTSAILLGNDAPSFVGVSSTIFMKDLYNMGLVKDITAAVEGNESFNSNLEASIEACKYSDGKIIGYPTNMEIPLLGFYNSALTEAGYDPENFSCETWDEYYEIAKKLTTSAHAGASIYASEFFLWPNNWFLSNGAELAVQNSDGTIKLNYTDKKVTDTIEFLRKLYGDGLTNDNIGFTDVDNMFTLLYNKTVSSFTMYPTWISRFIDAGIDPNEITLKKFPKGPSGEYKSAMYVASKIFNSSLSDEQLDAAIKYVAFMNSEEYWNDYFKYCSENSISTLNIPTVKDVDWWSSLTDFPEQWISVTKEALETATDTSLNSNGYSTYISAVLPGIISSSDTDVAAEMEKAAKTTENEWLNDFNKSVKK